MAIDLASLHSKAGTEYIAGGAYFGERGVLGCVEIRLAAGVEFPAVMMQTRPLGECVQRSVLVVSIPSFPNF